MCGIAGIVAPEAVRHREAVRRMIDSLKHRGPDASGCHFFPDCALGHRRLSIVDLDTGQQPMLSPVTGAGVTFNGELYGYKEIRASHPDYPFRTASDTEVILALYEQHRNDFVQRLPGMFAFALWDDGRKELVCARDRFGEKPFYYAFGSNGELLFASEIKGILASGLVRPVLSKDSVAHYMKFLYVHPHRTIYENIYSLPPAHSLRYSAGRLSVERYWHPPVTRGDLEVPEAVERFQRLLDQSVARQLVADVTVGAFLSGGLDSSTIVALAARHQARLRTFSFDFEDATSELPFAREVANRYRTDHTELSAAHLDMGDLLLTMQDIYDEPFADSSNIPTYLMSKLAREHVKVVLTGDGGDELLAGYSYWYQPLFSMQESRDRKSVWNVFLLAALIFSRITGRQLPLPLHHRALGATYAIRGGSMMRAHRRQQQYFSDKELTKFGLTPPGSSDDFGPDSPTDTIDDAFRLDLEQYMPGDILVKTDRSSMANGLELRAPFLDVDFASFCISLPYRMKIDKEQDKRILRQAYSDAWPPSVRRRGKQGFGAPVGRWLRLPPVKALKEEYLDNSRGKLFSFLPFDRTRRAAGNNDYQTWILLVLALWMERHDLNLA